MRESISRILIGSPLPTAEEVHRRLSKAKALAVFSSDALSSVAYAPEEILLVLVLGGAAILRLSIPIALCITALLAIVGASYYQTIHSYPSGGGAYIVARENLGKWPGLTAGAALLIDYVLTVAVSITAGVAAITAAFPALQPFGIPLALLTLVLICWGNLRGLRESGTIFSIPTYAFLGIVMILLVVGLTKLLNGSLVPATPPAITTVAGGSQAVMLVLVLRAFASGTTALTGIEAISNGIPAFKKPEAKNAGKTLVAMVILLGLMFLGIVFLASRLALVPVQNETIMSQIGKAVFGQGPLYLCLQVVTALILFMAANTPFADFPRLSAILARDRFLPRQLANLGDRLVFSNGISALAVLAAILIVIFGGDQHRLIPLYAVGVFLSFTLSQAGMVRKWFSGRTRGWIWKAAPNGLGAVATAVVLLVITASKFVDGAWVVVLIIPLLVGMLHAIEQHYNQLAEQLTLRHMRPQKWRAVTRSKRHKVVVPLSGMHRGTLAALHFARSLSKDVTAVVVDIEPEVTNRIREHWPQWGGDIPLVVLESPYRSTLRPLLSFLEEVDQRQPERVLAVVVLPEFIPAKWWHRFLHNQTAQLIKRALIYRRGLAGTDRVLIDIPYHLRY